MTAHAGASKTIQAPQIEPLMVDIVGVARLLGISRRHAQALDSSGRLGPTPIKLGRSARWDVASIREWVAAGCPIRAKWVTMREGRR